MTFEHIVSTNSSHASIKQIFANRLRNVMINNNMNQTELAKQLHLASPSTVSKWLKGTNLPRLDTVEQLSKLFNVSTAYFVVPMHIQLGGNKTLSKVLDWCFTQNDFGAHLSLVLKLIDLSDDDLEILDELCTRLKKSASKNI